MSDDMVARSVVNTDDENEKGALDILGITADQLKIARALDKARIMEIRNMIKNKYMLSRVGISEVLETWLEWLPAFEDENK